jgi:hypothetical protein
VSTIIVPGFSGPWTPFYCWDATVWLSCAISYLQIVTLKLLKRRPVPIFTKETNFCQLANMFVMLTEIQRNTRKSVFKALAIWLGNKIVTCDNFAEAFNLYLCEKYIHKYLGPHYKRRFIILWKSMRSDSAIWQNRT